MKKLLSILTLVLGLSVPAQASYYGDYCLGDTLYWTFTTTDAGAPTTLAGTPDIAVYEDDSITQIDGAGETLTVDLDTVTGLNLVTVAATSGNGYEVGKHYSVVIDAGTVGGNSVVGYTVGSFSIETSSSLRATDCGTNDLDVNGTGRAGLDYANTSGTIDAADINADVIDLIWDEDIVAAHNTADTAGEILDGDTTGGVNVADMDASVIDAAAIADAAIDDATFAADTDTYQAHLSYESTSTTTEFQLWWSDNGVHATGLSAASVDVWCFTNDGSATDVIGTSAAPTAFSEASTYDTFYLSDTYDLVDGTNYMCRLRATIDASTRTWYAPLDRSIGIRSASQLDEAGGTGDQLTAIPWNAAWDAEVESEVADELGSITDLGGGATVGANLSDLAGATFDTSTDSQEAIRNRGDSAWTTGAGGTGLTYLAQGTAQGGTSTTIQLAAAASFGDDILNNNIVKITSGTGAGQSRRIIDYVGSTDTATVVPAWKTNPDATSVYEIVDGDPVGGSSSIPVVQ